VLSAPWAREGHTADELQGVQPAHELQIVLKTAQGMTNHGIGKALFRSRRTVGARRYRVFPRLGNTAHPQRAQALAHVRVAADPRC